jgi:hypothetical protein
MIRHVTRQNIPVDVPGTRFCSVPVARTICSFGVVPDVMPLSRLPRPLLSFLMVAETSIPLEATLEVGHALLPNAT